ncbi:MAG: FkbM family methyltransferase, partial [Candidatus Hadarchaeales archaeon]
MNSYPTYFSSIEKIVPLPFQAKVRITDTAKKNIEEVVQKNLLLFLREGDVFLDIGAYVGYYTLLASRKVGKSGVVIAVEPDKKNFKMLLFNTRKLQNVIPVNAAVYSKNTLLSLLGEGATTSVGLGEKNLVKAFTLDT